MTQRSRLVGLGVGATLAVALPAALIAQVLDARSENGLPGAVSALIAAVTLLGAGVGGWIVGTRPARPSLVVAGLSGLLAVGLVQALGVVWRTIADEEVAWGGDVLVLVLGGVAAVTGAALGRWALDRSRDQAPPPARTRP